MHEAKGRAFNQIPGPKGHWLKGNTQALSSGPMHQVFAAQAATYGDIVKFRIWHKSLVILSKPKTIQWILKERPHRFRRSNKIEKAFKEMGVHGVFSAEADTWSRQRQLMNPAFKPSQVKQFLPMICWCARALCDDLSKNRQANDIQRALMTYTVNITASLAFGIDLKAFHKDDPLFQQHLNKVFPMLSYRLEAPFPYWRLFKLERDRQLDESLNYVHKVIFAFIEHARFQLQEKDHNKNGVLADNLLQAMILAQQEDGSQLSDEELSANVVTLLLAGEDTTANTLAWALHFLADHPELQDDLFAEVQRNYPKDGVLTMEALDNFPLCFAAAQEAMRLKPVAPFLFLEGIHDEIIDGYHIPRGTLLVALTSHVGGRAEVFDRPEQFKPTRWLNLSSHQRKTYANDLLHFGYGPRLCPGRQLSFIEMKVALVELMKRYKFGRNTSAGPVEDLMAFTVVPQNLRLDIEVR